MQKKKEIRKTQEEVDATLSDIAKMLGTSRAYVSQIERQALEKLRKKLQERLGITSLDDLL